MSQLWNVSLHTYGPLIEALRVITDYQRNGRRRLRFYIRTESEELEDLDNTTSLDIMTCVNLATEFELAIGSENTRCWSTLGDVVVDDRKVSLKFMVRWMKVDVVVDVVGWAAQSIY